MGRGSLLRGEGTLLLPMVVAIMWAIGLLAAASRRTIDSTTPRT